MKRLLVVGGCLLLTACASTPSHPQDPLEPLNRAVYRFNDAADKAVLKPVAQAYQQVTPQPVRTGVGNFFDNLRDVYSAANNTLQGKAELALTDVLRVSFNSTFGLFGLIDIATPMGLKSSKATLGDTFAHYGWQESSYLVLPLLGPSTVRDGSGMLISNSLEPATSVFHTHTQATVARVLNAVNTREKLLGLEEMVDGAALDSYSYMRDGFLQMRAHQLGLSQGKQQAEEELNIDDLVDEPDASAPAVNAPSDASAPEAKDASPP
ncbi:MlaA family lipoprotein [Vogesella indigofera]|uniref:MlaA family lipoprotein n=1 Tax=Vogesella indigofera TaxID=45465 RepID=UPI00234E6702|nr:VacJ family lipoprotein [Vogesella indigofera]MDC7710002.1 VacJ family lipoprotein [Vogesella indigofera]